MALFTIYIVYADKSRAIQPVEFDSARPAFEAAFQLADRLAGAEGDSGTARFVDVYEGERLCIGIGVARGGVTSR